MTIYRCDNCGSEQETREALVIVALAKQRASTGQWSFDRLIELCDVCTQPSGTPYDRDKKILAIMLEAMKSGKLPPP